VIGPLNLGSGRAGDGGRPRRRRSRCSCCSWPGLATSLPLRAGGAPTAGGRSSRRVTEAAMIRKPWTAASMLVAAPAAPLFPAVTVNSRPGPGPGRGGHGHGAAAATPSGCIHRAHRMILAVPWPLAAPAQPRSPSMPPSARAFA